MAQPLGVTWFTPETSKTGFATPVFTEEANPFFLVLGSGGSINHVSGLKHITLESNQTIPRSMRGGHSGTLVISIPSADGAVLIRQQKGP